MQGDVMLLMGVMAMCLMGCQMPTPSPLEQRRDGESIEYRQESDASVPERVDSQRLGLKDDPANRPRRAAAFWASFYTDVVRKCRAMPEQCDGRDNNCNGQVDEGC